MASDEAPPRVLQYELADEDTEPELEPDPDEEVHPATVAAARIMAEHPNDPNELDEAVRFGVASAYDLHEDDIHIPPSRIRGRTSQPTAAGTHFTACVRDGKLRVDHTGDEAFWLEMDLPSVLMEPYMAWRYRPDGEVAQRAAKRFKKQMGESASKQTSPPDPAT